MADRLQSEYTASRAGVLFLEHDIDVPLGGRIDRWWAAYDARGHGGAAFPLIVIDSGYGLVYGLQDDLTATLRTAIADAAARPPGAEMYAAYTRTGDSIEVAMRVTNRSDAALGTDNWATLTVIVFERAMVLHSGRFVRSASELDIRRPLPTGATANYALRLKAVPVEDWGRAGVVVLLDYQPRIGSYLYDALQSAIATEVGQSPLRLPLVLRGHTL